MVDGIVELTDVRYQSRTERALFVNKLRGSDYLPGRHPFRITPDGLVVYPRIEAAYRVTSQPDRVRTARIASGVAGLDAMIGGGLAEASVTALVGPSGVGKTTMGLQFLAQSTAEQPGLLFSFYETPPRVLWKAEALGIALGPAVDRGDVEIIWQPQSENIQDALAHRLLDAIAQRKVRRFVLDGLGGLLEASVEPERISRFMAVLTNELRARGVTTIYTLETRDVIGSGIEMPVTGMSSLLENLIAMRYVEYHARAQRLLSVLKTRDSAFDATLRRFTIGAGGILLEGGFGHAEQILSGHARDRDGVATGPGGAGGQAPTPEGT
jgi:circadian clock protein KaiC